MSLKPAKRAAVLARNDGRCEAAFDGCDGESVQVHHVLKVEHGGRDNLANLRGICDACHRWIHQNEYDARQIGWLLAPPPLRPRWDRPAERVDARLQQSIGTLIPTCGVPHPVWENVRCTRFAGHRAPGSGAEKDLRHSSVYHSPTRGPLTTWWS